MTLFLITLKSFLNRFEPILVTELSKKDPQNIIMNLKTAQIKR